MWSPNENSSATNHNKEIPERLPACENSIKVPVSNNVPGPSPFVVKNGSGCDNFSKTQEKAPLTVYVQFEKESTGNKECPDTLGTNLKQRKTNNLPALISNTEATILPQNFKKDGVAKEHQTKSNLPKTNADKDTGILVRENNKTSMDHVEIETEMRENLKEILKENKGDKSISENAGNQIANVDDVIVDKLMEAIYAKMERKITEKVLKELSLLHKSSDNEEIKETYEEKTKDVTEETVAASSDQRKIISNKTWIDLNKNEVSLQELTAKNKVSEYLSAKFKKTPQPINNKNTNENLGKTTKVQDYSSIGSSTDGVSNQRPIFVNQNQNKKIPISPVIIDDRDDLSSSEEDVASECAVVDECSSTPGVQEKETGSNKSNDHEERLSESDDNELTHECGNCHKLYSSFEKLSAHIKKCIIPGVSPLKTKSKYVKNKERRDGYDEIVCNYKGCDYTSPFASNYDRHVIEEHTKDYPYHCVRCNKGFVTTSNYYQHVFNECSRKKLRQKSSTKYMDNSKSFTNENEKSTLSKSNQVSKKDTPNLEQPSSDTNDHSQNAKDKVNKGTNLNEQQRNNNLLNLNHSTNKLDKNDHLQGSKNKISTGKPPSFREQLINKNFSNSNSLNHEKNNTKLNKNVNLQNAKINISQVIDTNEGRKSKNMMNSLPNFNQLNKSDNLQSSKTNTLKSDEQHKSRNSINNSTNSEQNAVKRNKGNQLQSGPESKKNLMKKLDKECKKTNFQNRNNSARKRIHTVDRYQIKECSVVLEDCKPFLALYINYSSEEDSEGYDADQEVEETLTHKSSKKSTLKNNPLPNTNTLPKTLNPVDILNASNNNIVHKGNLRNRDPYLNNVKEFVLNPLDSDTTDTDEDSFGYEADDNITEASGDVADDTSSQTSLLDALCNRIPSPELSGSESWHSDTDDIIEKFPRKMKIFQTKKKENTHEKKMVNQDGQNFNSSTLPKQGMESIENIVLQTYNSNSTNLNERRKSVIHSINSTDLEEDDIGNSSTPELPDQVISRKLGSYITNIENDKLVPKYDAQNSSNKPCTSNVTKENVDVVHQKRTLMYSLGLYDSEALQKKAECRKRKIEYFRARSQNNQTPKQPEKQGRLVQEVDINMQPVCRLQKIDLGDTSWGKKLPKMTLFECEYSGCSFKTKKKKWLNLHINRIHTGNQNIFPFFCIPCSIGFYMKSNYDRHKDNIHTVQTVADINSSTEEDVVDSLDRGEGYVHSKPKHRCKYPGCRYKTSQPFQLKMHIIHKHGGALKVSKNINKKMDLGWKCDYCLKEFEEHYLLFEHKRRYHPNQSVVHKNERKKLNLCKTRQKSSRSFMYVHGMYSCRFKRCKFKCEEKSVILQHCADKHKKRQVSCELCHLTFPNKIWRRKHVRKKHKGQKIVDKNQDMSYERVFKGIKKELLIASKAKSPSPKSPNGDKRKNKDYFMYNNNNSIGTLNGTLNMHTNSTHKIKRKNEFYFMQNNHSLESNIKSDICLSEMSQWKAKRKLNISSTQSDNSTKDRDTKSDICLPEMSPYKTKIKPNILAVKHRNNTLQPNVVLKKIPIDENVPKSFNKFCTNDVSVRLDYMDIKYIPSVE